MARSKRTARGAEGNGATPAKEHMVVVRESDTSDELLMLGMIHQTMLACRDVPGARRADELGLEPLHTPAAVGGEYRRTRSHKMVLFDIEGTLFLYAMGSAAKLDGEDATNDYAELLLEALRVFRPRHLHLASVTRLLRSTKFANVFETELVEMGTLLHAEGGNPMDLSRLEGRMLYQMYASFAAFERDTIVLRTTVGRVAAARRGQLILPPDVLPLGYRVDDRRNVVPDDSKREQVRTLLEILALPDITSRQRAALVGAAGIRLPRGYGDAGISDDLADSRDPKSAMRGFYKWIELYATGVYTMRHTNPLPLAEMISDLPVHRDPDKPSDPGWINIENRWGLPEGGWVDPDLIAAARAQDDARRVKFPGTGGLGHQKRKPLLGAARWTEEGTEWLLDSHCKNDYRLRRRSAADAGPKGGWIEPSIDGQVVARVRAADLHTSLAAGIATALETGVAAERLTASAVHEIGGRLFATAPPESAAEATRRRIDEHRREAQRMRAAAAGMDTEDAAPWIADAVKADRRARRLAKELDEQLARAVDASPATLTGLVADAEVCARAIAALGRITTDTHRSAADAITTILRDLRLTIDGPNRLAWSVHVLLPVAGGAALLGPITGTVATVVSRGAWHGSILTTKRDTATAMEILATGAGLQEVTEAIPSWGIPAARRVLTPEYQNRGLDPRTFSVLKWCSVPQVRRAVFTTLLHHPNPDPATFPHIAAELDLDGVDPGWTTNVLTAYLTPGTLGIPRNWAARSIDEQRLLDTIAGYGGVGVPIAYLRIPGNGWTRPQIASRLLNEHIHKDFVRHPTALRGTWETHPGGRILPRSTILPIVCPHCGGLAVRIWRAAEVPRQLLCTTCRRMPIPDSPVYPKAYLLLPPGGRGNRLGLDNRAISRSSREWLDNLDDDTREKLSQPCQQCHQPFVGLLSSDKYCHSCSRMAWRDKPRGEDAEQD